MIHRALRPVTFPSKATMDSRCDHTSPLFDQKYTEECARKAWSRADEIRKRMAGPEDVSDDDIAAMNAAVDEADQLRRQAEMGKAAWRMRMAELDANRSFERERNPWGASSFRSSTIGQPAAFGMSPTMYNTDGGASMPHTDARNTRGGRHGYSFMRALKGATALREGLQFDGLEAETHAELVRLRGASTRGVLVPWDAPISRSLLPASIRYRDLTTTTGAGAIPFVVAPTLIDLLRARLVVVALGATVMPDMQTGFGIPRQSAASTGYWVTEGTAPTASNAQLDQVMFNPRTAGANTKLTRKFIDQSSIAAEDFAVSELVKTVAQTVERAALNGSGSGAEPTGILQLSDVPAVTIATNGGALTWLKTLEFIGKLSSANAPLESRAWLINPQTKAKMGGTPRETGYPKYLYDFDDPVSPIAGFPVLETTNLPSTLSKGSSGNVLSAAIFGAWTDLVVALFSAVDVVVDPFTESTAGNVRISVFQDVDVNVRHQESFLICKEIVTA
mgnify:CR=1 FL=1